MCWGVVISCSEEVDAFEACFTKKAKWWACKCLRNCLIFSFSNSLHLSLIFLDALIYFSVWGVSVTSACHERDSSKPEAAECWCEQSPKFWHLPQPLCLYLTICLCLISASFIFSISFSVHPQSCEAVRAHLCETESEQEQQTETLFK